MTDPKAFELLPVVVESPARNTTGRNLVIHVVAMITANPGQRDTVLSEFRGILAEVRAEAGCIEYAPVIDAEGTLGGRTTIGPDGFIVVEKWASMDALKAHAAAPHMAAYAARVKDKIAARAVYALTPAE